MPAAILDRLHAFPDHPQPPAECFGAALQDSSVRTVICYADDACAEHAESYAAMLGIEGKTRTVLTGTLSPHLAAAQADQQGGVVPLIINAARNPALKDRFFRDPHPQVHAFVDHHYVRSDLDDGLDLVTVGTTRNGVLTTANIVPERNLPHAMELREQAMRRMLGSRVMTYFDVRAVLNSVQVQSVPMHALGPEGTNIALASRRYAADVVGGRAAITVHPQGVEPRQYAALAADEVGADRLPLHMECAVYYDMHALRAERPGEMTFADHQHMPLIPMVLGTTLSDAELGRRGNLVLASHPSPLPLVHGLVADGTLTHRKASSNADAAIQVQQGAADICITTRAALQKHGLREAFNFGSPNMIFTLGTPLSQDAVRSLRMYA